MQDIPKGVTIESVVEPWYPTRHVLAIVTLHVQHLNMSLTCNVRKGTRGLTISAPFSMRPNSLDGPRSMPHWAIGDDWLLDLVTYAAVAAYRNAIATGHLRHALRVH